MAGNKKPRKPPTGKDRNAGAALPLSFGMSAEQAARLKRIPLDSLNKFQEKKATKLDSTNIYLRLVSGLYICLNILEMKEDAAAVYEPIKEAIETMRGIMFRNDGTEQTEWRMSPGETDIILEALDIVSQLQDQITRREMLFAFRESQKSIEQAFRKANPGKKVPTELHQQVV